MPSALWKWIKGLLKVATWSLLLLFRQERQGITCPTPTSVEHADIRVKNYSINSRERYVCNSGFKRKAGTSSLTQCVFNETAKVAHWTTPNLKCIKKESTAGKPCQEKSKNLRVEASSVIFRKTKPLLRSPCAPVPPPRGHRAGLRGQASLLLSVCSANCGPAAVYLVCVWLGLGLCSSCGAWVSHCCGFFCCGSTGSRRPGFRNCSSWIRSCGSRALAC
ncbi:hypothetical protein FD754_013356 [Muntiacus muntjak]|uniref:Interleukin-15 receptor subunit alpha n=1 Tax=Muntiacus muntjak TaxID=9888 RepID=A0A5N3VGU6_MUNMU|nr:hypothetical protein FD754_013356 [Muntiacus muntjak]